MFSSSISHSFNTQLSYTFFFKTPCFILFNFVSMYSKLKRQLNCELDRTYQPNVTNDNEQKELFICNTISALRCAAVDYFLYKNHTFAVKMRKFAVSTFLSRSFDNFLKLEKKTSLKYLQIFSVTNDVERNWFFKPNALRILFHRFTQNKTKNHIK